MFGVGFCFILLWVMLVSGVDCCRLLAFFVGLGIARASGVNLSFMGSL